MSSKAGFGVLAALGLLFLATKKSDAQTSPPTSIEYVTAGDGIMPTVSLQVGATLYVSPPPGGTITAAVAAGVVGVVQPRASTVAGARAFVALSPGTGGGIQLVWNDATGVPHSASIPVSVEVAKVAA